MHAAVFQSAAIHESTADFAQQLCVIIIATAMLQTAADSASGRVSPQFSRDNAQHVI
jgi:hypothetical protein